MESKPTSRPTSVIVTIWLTETTPDSIDMLATAKNHDLKASRVSAAESDAWLFALMTLQTCEGWGGATNYGISRMNSGSGSYAAPPPARRSTHQGAVEWQQSKGSSAGAEIDPA